MKIGYHCEGNDHLILHHLLCRLAGLDEAIVEAARTRAQRLNNDQVLDLALGAVRRFYYDPLALAAVVATDNDGQLDHRGSAERRRAQDPSHPRHWVHRPEVAAHPACRACELHGRVRRARDELRPTGTRSPHDWPVVICVAVEDIEAWLLAARSLVAGKPRDAEDAELEAAGKQHKVAFYGSAMATESQVLCMALPLLRSLDDLSELARVSQSFRRFAWQVRLSKTRMRAAAAYLGETV